MILNLTALLLLGPLLCAAAQNCAWINPGTVGGILGGAVDSKIIQSQQTCEFTRRSGSTVYTLRLEVKAMAQPQQQFPKYLSECKSKPTPLKAIGNEAVTCSAGVAELAIGRVRDQAFIIRVSTNDRSAKRDELADKARAAAAHVAGSLF